MVINIQSTIDSNNTAAIHQKRTLAFVNHFVIKTVQFMNNFSSECENKLMDFESKMQKVEASLMILESKLSSIPNLETPILQNIDTIPAPEVVNHIESQNHNIADTVDGSFSTSEQPQEHDSRYDRFFKMCHVGVPIEAVRIKIIQEGLDPSVLK